MPVLKEEEAKRIAGDAPGNLSVKAVVQTAAWWYNNSDILTDRLIRRT